MKLYNTLTRKLEEFIPIKVREVGMYSCGPTVYWNQHIGNMYAFLQWDILVRTFNYLGYKVKWVMNITDVGHMTGDNFGAADTGEDRLEKRAKIEKISVWDIADKYIAQFLDSIDKLNIHRPDVLCRATENIDAQISLINRIEKNGFAYKTKMGLVFDTSKFPDYSKFANLKFEKLKKREDVEDDPEKKNAWDFFLWVTGNTDHIMQWDSPWGRGYPGWHIECTAMSTKYLGDNFDIHTGGIEHIGIHHTNEMAQGYGAFGKSTANFWLHNAWLVGKKGEKLSKSSGKIVTVQELADMGYDPLAFRYLVLNSNYKKGLNFSFEALDGASESLNKLRNILQGIKNNKIGRTNLSEDKLKKIKMYKSDFVDALNDDLNLPKALAVIWETVKSNIPNTDKYDLIADFDSVLGLKLREHREEKVEVPDMVKKLLDDREKHRRSKNFIKADELRKKIEKMGYILEDKDGGTVLKKINGN